MCQEPRTHRLKTHPEPFAQALEGIKRHTIRRDDRGYQLGDLVVKAEWDPFARAFTGREVGPFTITSRSLTMFEFALMGFGKVQDTVISDHIVKAVEEFEARRGGAIPRGWFVQFQRNANGPIPACPACGKPL